MVITRLPPPCGGAIDTHSFGDEISVSGNMYFVTGMFIS